jgi:peptide/nickel transport system permease protein
MLGDRATPQTLAHLQHEMGLGRSFAYQFGIYLLHTAEGRFGDSITMHAPAGTLILQRLPVTLMLTAYATILAILIGVPLAFAAALRPDGIADAIIRVTAQLGLSMPVFNVLTIVLAVMVSLIFLLSDTLQALLDPRSAR